MPSWETVQKAPLCTNEEWADLRIALARRVKEAAVTTSDREKSSENHISSEMGTAVPKLFNLAKSDPF